MNIEAVVLTGGASRRMGFDKAGLKVEAVPLAQLIASRLSEAGFPVTILGREPVDGFRFLGDAEEYAGPLAALSRFEPTCEAVFVASCDMPLFDAKTVEVLAEYLAADAVVPFVGGRLQPTCALYRASAFEAIPEVLFQGHKSLTAWLERLKVREFTEAELQAAGVQPRTLQGANTPEDLRNLLDSDDLQP